MKASQLSSQEDKSFTAAEPEKPLRQRTPHVSAWVDDLRQAFGREFIDGRIKLGMKGEPVFFASENGVVVGTPMTQAGIAITFDATSGIAQAKAIK